MSGTRLTTKLFDRNIQSTDQCAIKIDIARYTHQSIKTQWIGNDYDWCEQKTVDKVSWMVNIRVSNDSQRIYDVNKQYISGKAVAQELKKCWQEISDSLGDKKISLKIKKSIMKNNIKEISGELGRKIVIEDIETLKYALLNQAALKEKLRELANEYLVVSNSRSWSLVKKEFDSEFECKTKIRTIM